MKFGPTYLGHFEGDIFVRCPCCGYRAHLLRRDDDLGRHVGYRFVCDSCARAHDWSLERDRSIPLPTAGPHLNGFGLDLWLQTPCCGETLWAFNEPHIEFMERFIAAGLRERDVKAWGWSRNSSLESRLPRWMQAAKNRESVLKSLKSLRELMRQPD
jgi:hypothetical protein